MNDSDCAMRSPCGRPGEHLAGTWDYFSLHGSAPCALPAPAVVKACVVIGAVEAPRRVLAVFLADGPRARTLVREGVERVLAADRQRRAAAQPNARLEVDNRLAGEEALLDAAGWTGRSVQTRCRSRTSRRSSSPGRAGSPARPAGSDRWISSGFAVARRRTRPGAGR